MGTRRRGRLSPGRRTRCGHLRSLGPLTSAHVHFGVVDAERLDFDDDMTGQGLRLRQVLVDQAVRSTEFLDDNGTDHESPEDRQQALSTTTGVAVLPGPLGYGFAPPRTRHAARS